MKVKELIEKLQEMDQEAVVNCYDYHYGDQWKVCSSVELETTGWDRRYGCPILEVFIQ